MKTTLLIFLLFIQGVQAACLPDSPVLTSMNKALVDVRAAESAVDSFYEVIKPEIPDNNELVIRIEALNPRVNADITRNQSELVIQIMGGMLKHPRMSPEVLLLLLCHEIGHFLGGPPLKSRNGWSSTEGQADYYSGHRCARTLGFDAGTFTDAALRLTSIYAEVGREPMPKLERCEERTVERTNYGYPSAQCRLDTLIAGWYGQARPRCWFSE